MSSSISLSANWQQSQSFGQKEPVGTDEKPDSDHITSVEFDDSGNFLAVGDKGGRIVIFNNKMDRGSNVQPEYTMYTEFQSHDPEFDYLKSLDIEEKINKIRWCKTPNHAKFLISSNDKTIKCWKIHNKTVKTVSQMNLSTGSRMNKIPVKIDKIVVPKVSAVDNIVVAKPRKVYSNAHAYHINSISCNSDGEHFLSADDLRINLWNLERNDQCFNILDIKPSNMEDLTEVITAAEFHPTKCNIYIYSSSGGSIRLGDMRTSAICDNHAVMFQEEEDPSARSFFSEIISSISDIKFTQDGRYIVSRDYLTLKVWDINMDSKPLKTIPIHEHLRPKLCDLYESDCIFDKFETSVSPDGNNYVTGSYSNYFHVYDRYGKNEHSVVVNPNKPKILEKPALNRKKVKTPEVVPDILDYSRKSLHMSWHPNRDTIAVAISRNLYIYNSDTIL